MEYQVGDKVIIAPGEFADGVRFAYIPRMVLLQGKSATIRERSPDSLGVMTYKLAEYLYGWYGDWLVPMECDTWNL